MQVIFYTHATCTLCEDARVLLDILESIYNLEIEERDIYTNDVWLEKYLISVPVIEISGKQFMHPHVTFETMSSFIEETLHSK